MAELINDPFGRRKIYPTNTHPNRAKPWLLGKDDWHDRRYDTWFDGNWEDYEISMDSNNDDVIKFSNDPLFGGSIKGRFPILALRLDQYPRDMDNNTIIWSEKNQSILRKRGFMGTKQDWKNVEITMYWIVEGISNSGYRAMGFSVRGGPHHSSGGFFGISPCWGTALYVALRFDGVAKIQKELGHGHYTDSISTEDTVTGGDIRDRWVGMKGIFYTKANGNPYIELWLDKNANNYWERILYKEDDGTWFLSDGVDNDCSGERNEKITWGGPGIIFKLDRLTRVDMKWASIREIMPPEGWPLKYLLKAREVSFPVSMRSLAADYGLAIPISLRELTEREAERYPFP
jgi:hypothetical protein